jgi:hypothetical protein
MVAVRRPAHFAAEDGSFPRTLFIAIDLRLSLAPERPPQRHPDEIAGLTRHDKEHRSLEFPREMRTQCGPTECPERAPEPGTITNPQVDSGRAGIRTRERVAPLAVFKAA